MFLDADQDLAKITAKIKYYQMIGFFLESVLKQISARQYQIKNAIEWEKFRVADIKLQKKNEVYNVVTTEPHIHRELSEYFTFEVPEAKFMPLYRNKVWDGKIRLYSPGNGEIYGGLTEHLIQWCKTMRYTMEYEENKYFGLPDETNDEITLSGIRTFMQGITKFEPKNLPDSRCLRSAEIQSQTAAVFQLPAVSP